MALRPIIGGMVNTGSGGGGSGTVTSVAMTVPGILSVTGSPVTGAGTLAVSLVNQNANLVLAGPTTGAAATPAFRALVAADIPQTIATAKVIYVSATGSDVTGQIGNPAKPFATGTAAVVAGEAGAEYYVLFGFAGSFTVTLSAATEYLRGFAGMGYTRVLALCRTLWTVNAQPVAQTNNSGTASYWQGSYEYAVHNCGLILDARGGNTSAGDAGTYNAGAGSDAILFGIGTVSVDTRGGGDEASTDGQVNGGAGGSITLKGALTVGNDGLLANTGGVAFAGGTAGADGQLSSDGCDLREGSVSLGTTITCGRTSYTGSAFTVSADKGGNASY